MAFSRFILYAALSVCAALPLRAAPPANDDFANRLTLTSGMASTVSNVDATMEGAEPFPAGYDAGSYQGTVWWEWSPAISGWNEINTVGSAVNTVLAVWSGADYSSPLALVHVNDEAAEGSVSRIRFLASSSVSYKIAVASRTAARGSVTLLATGASSSFAMVVAPQLGDPALLSRNNAAAAAPQLTFNVRITSTGAGAEISSGLITLIDSANAEVSTAVFDATNRISGFTNNGLYAVNMTVPSSAPAGSYRWRIRITRMSGAVSSWGWEGMTPLPAGVPATVTLINDPFAAWAEANSLTGGDAAKGADPDGDGLKNLAEYECGLDPNNPALRPLIVSGGVITQTGLPDISVVGTGDQQRLRIVYLRRIADPSVTLTARFSDDLVNWADATQAATVIANDGVFQALAVEDDIFVPAKTRRNALVRMVSP